MKRSRVKAGPSRKRRTLEYTVMVAGEEISVCRVAFFNIHGIGEKRVRVALSKLNDAGVLENT